MERLTCDLLPIARPGFVFCAKRPISYGRAAPAQDSHLGITQVAVCIRALLSIVNRYTDFPSAAHLDASCRVATFRQIVAIPFGVRV
jgi:hypothetical protein